MAAFLQTIFSNTFCWMKMCAFLSTFHWGLPKWSHGTHSSFSIGLKLIEAEWRICVGNLTIIGSDNGLSPGRRQAITWTKVGILLIGPLGINFSEMLIEIQTFSLKKIHLKMSSAKWRPFCLGLNVLSNGLAFSYKTLPEPFMPQIDDAICCRQTTMSYNPNTVRKIIIMIKWADFIWLHGKL